MCACKYYFHFVDRDVEEILIHTANKWKVWKHSPDMLVATLPVLVDNGGSLERGKN